MMKNMIWILLHMVSLPVNLYGTPVSEETLQDLLNRRIMLPTTKIITLRDLYGSGVNRQNFNPGAAMLQFLNEHPHQDTYVIFSHIPYIPTARDFDVPFEYLVEVAEIVAHRDNLLSIKGGPETGKTKGLKIIELTLLNRLEPVLAVYVDLPQIFNSEAVHISSSEDLLRMSIATRDADFVKNVAEVNPSRVRILMDNIDEILPVHKEQIFAAISDLRSRRIGVTVSSTTDVAPLFNQRHLNPRLFTIPPVSEMEFDDISEIYWQQTLGETFLELHFERIRQYSKALRLMFFETPLPRSVGLVRRLLDQAVFMGLQAVPSLMDFVENPEKYPSPRTILRLSDSMYFDKAIFYNKLLPEPSEVYGIQALKMVLKPLTGSVLYELDQAIKSSNNEINQHGTEVYKLMTFENGEPVDFLHQEYKRYYAAKYISNSFATDTTLINSFQTIIHKSRYSFVAEFINSGMPHLSNDAQLKMMAAAQLIAKELDVAFQITDNLISHRLDILSSVMLKALGEKNLLIKYLDNPITLKSQNKYSFGMLSEVRNVDKRYYIPRKTRWMYSGNRIEMILNLKLRSSLHTILQHGYMVDPNLELISAARRRHGLAELLNGNNRRKYPVEVLNRAMYESLKALGPESIENMRTLRARGAQPAAINVGGRTLAHEAARWHSQKLLKVIHEEFLVSLYDAPDKSGQTILFELLDHALPSNAYLQEYAWKSITYLVEHGDLYVNEKIIKKSMDSFKSYTPPLDKVDLSYRNLIVQNDDNRSSRRDVVDTLTTFIPIEDADISREILSMRRLLIIKNCLKAMLKQSETRKIAFSKTPDFVTVAELVLSHKPIENTFHFHHYQNAMKYMLTKKSRSFNPPQMERVCNIIVKNMYMAVDFVQITQMIRKDVVKVEPEIISSMKQAYELRIQHGLPRLHVDQSFETMAVETVYGLHPDIEFNDAMTEAAAIMENLDFSDDYPNHDPHFNVFFCDI